MNNCTRMISRTWRFFALTAAAVSTVFLAPQATAADSAEKQPEQDDGYLRMVESEDGIVSLEIAITTFKSDDASAPTITMVGVAHIGDDAYYNTLQDVLDAHDLVLYESVMPEGVNRSDFETDHEREQYTRSAVTFVWAQALAFEQATGRAAESLEELGAFANRSDSRIGNWVEHATDGWGRPLVYDCAEERGCVLLSYGADGDAGGEGLDADIVSTEPAIAARAAAYAEAPDDQLQAQLADALGLEFQLDTIDYAGDGWVCSDMTMSELSDAFADRGLDFGPIGSTLAGSSLSGTIAKVLLRLVQVADAMLDGAIADMFKVVMIEMLSDERIMDQSMEQFGAGFGDVIIGERNQVVMDDLEALVKEKQHETIAVFYGAGHLADFEARLHEQLGYKPVAKRWEPAITVNMAQSAIPERQLRQMRIMIRRSLQQSMAMQQRRQRD